MRQIFRIFSIFGQSVFATSFYTWGPKVGWPWWSSHFKLFILYCKLSFCDSHSSDTKNNFNLSSSLAKQHFARRKRLLQQFTFFFDGLPTLSHIHKNKNKKTNLFFLKYFIKKWNLIGNGSGNPIFWDI